jgi:hypothetical protein
LHGRSLLDAFADARSVTATDLTHIGFNYSGARGVYWLYTLEYAVRAAEVRDPSLGWQEGVVTGDLLQLLRAVAP